MEDCSVVAVRGVDCRSVQGVSVYVVTHLCCYTVVIMIADGH